MKVQAFSDEDEPASNALPARRWLAFEVSLDNRRYCMHNGRWCQIDDGLRESLARRIEAIVTAESPLAALPDWTNDVADEADYNAGLAALLAASASTASW